MHCLPVFLSSIGGQTSVNREPLVASGPDRIAKCPKGSRSTDQRARIGTSINTNRPIIANLAWDLDWCKRVAIYIIATTQLPVWIRASSQYLARVSYSQGMLEAQCKLMNLMIGHGDPSGAANHDRIIVCRI